MTARELPHVVTTVLANLCVLFVGCRTTDMPEPRTNVVLQSGEAIVFNRVECITLEMFEREKRVVIDVEESVRMATGLPRCSEAAADRLTVVYQAGLETCIDCTEERVDRWSGFAFLVASDAAGAEKGRAEWQGASGSSAEQLRHAFRKDLADLIR
jgi:hypothetical protein